MILPFVPDLPARAKRLAVAQAVKSLLRGEVKRIVLSRPIVECGERIGYLPGPLEDKAAPYMRPIDDVLAKFVDKHDLISYRANGIIEVCPLAYMKGRTFDESFMILDEAQNSSKKQITMFLSRIGYNSKVVVTGDPHQTDIDADGLSMVLRCLNGIDRIKVVRLDEHDIVRHDLIAKIMSAIEADSSAPRNGHRLMKHH